MKKTMILVGYVLVLNSCSINYNNYPVRNPQSNNASTANTEREYQELIKTYKSENAEVLTDILNDPSPNNPRTSVLVENKSSCNMVLTISGNNYFKKIPIGKGKIGTAMVLKNQNYKLSGMVCSSPYQATKFITSSYSVALSE